MDDLYNTLKIYEAEVMGSSSITQNIQNIAFVSSNNIDSTNKAVNTANGVSDANSKTNASNLPNVDSLSDAVIYFFFTSQSNSPQLDNEDLKQIDPDDLEEMDLKWQMAIRGYFARECKASKYQDNRNREAHKRTAKDGPTNFALMAYTSLSSSNSSNLDTKVSTCSKSYLKSYETLKEHYDNITKDFNKSQFNLGAYKASLEFVKARLEVYKKNEAVFEDDRKILKLDVMFKDKAITELRKKFGKAKKERDDLKLSLQKFKGSSKNLSRLLDSQQSDKSNTGLVYYSQGFGNQVLENHVNEKYNTGPKSLEDEVADDVGKKSTEVPRKENEVQDLAKEGDKNNQEKDVKDQEEAPRKQFEQESKRMFGQGEVANTNSTNRLNTVSSPVNAVSSSFTTVDPGRERAQRNVGSIPISAATFPNACLPTDPIMPDLKDTANTRIFNDAYDNEVELAEADFNNLKLSTIVSPIPTTRIHKDHPKEKIIGDHLLALQTRSMTKTSQEHAMMSSVGELTFFLGLQVMQKDDGIFISQDKFQVTPKVSHLHAVRRIFRYLKGQPKLGLWYPRDSPFDIEAFSDCGYTGASLDRKSTTGCCQFLRKRLISWQCKKQIVVANSTTEAEYVDAASCCGQDSAKVKTVNEDVQIRALIDGKKIIVIEASIRRDLQLQDAKGTACLPNDTIFGKLARIGAETIAWNEFSSTMASVIIYLEANQNFNFSKYILDNMIFVTPSLTKKVIVNMKREGKSFSMIITPLFETMMVQALEEVGEGSEVPTDTHHTPLLLNHHRLNPRRSKNQGGNRGRKLGFLTLSHKLRKVYLHLPMIHYLVVRIECN
nr:uncharacterized mitochondrial protein AtMg00810-like [Tanacetum cinerariifolium]